MGGAMVNGVKNASADTGRERVCKREEKKSRKTVQLRAGVGVQDGSGRSGLITMVAIQGPAKRCIKYKSIPTENDE